MRFNFSRQLQVLFIVSIIAPLVILSFAFAAYFDNLFIVETDQIFKGTLYSISQGITTYIDDLCRVTMTPYYNEETMNYLRDINSGRYFTDPVVSVKVNKNYRLAIAQLLYNSRKELTSFLFVPYDKPNDCAFLMSRNSGQLEILADFDVGNSDWFRGAVAANGEIYFPSVSGNVFSVARLIKDPDTMRPIGVIKVDAVDQVIANLFRHSSATNASSLMLLDQNNAVIYATASVPEAPIPELGTDTELVNYGNEEYYASMYPVASTPWRLLYLASKRDMQSQTTSIYVTVLLWCGLIFCVGIALFFANSRNTVHAMKQIVDAMQQIASGDLSVRLNLHTKSDFDIIAQALNQTADRLAAHIASEYKAVLTQRDAEYQALQAQINPHFLHNVLNGFVTLNRIGDRDKLEQSILRLSHLFRYTCSGSSHSTVEEELAFLEEYLGLQQLRFGKRLRYSIAGSPDAQSLIVPRLLLQPLVENAIIHGMEPYAHGINIQVSADIVSNPQTVPRLRLIVEDDGEGFEPQDADTGRVGLTNVIERLNLVSAESVFEIQSSPGKGCRCFIELPVQTAEGEEKTC